MTNLVFVEVLDTLDLSNKKLKKLSKPSTSEAQVSTLILDNNELQRLDNLDSFTKVQNLSAVKNQLLRMYGVCRLHCLHTLNLAHNGILTIEGLKELVNIKHLCLAGNSIKTIEHLNTNVNLEHLDLSVNSITHVSDLSFLKNLKELYLHGNKIGHLHQCDRFLPTSLVTLTLASNNIADLNEISHLSHLTNLTSISISNNPCVNFVGSNIGFDYRPFLINWCMNVRTIDGYAVDAIESLRAEWLYSQGRGRHFRVGEQKELSQYLATVCPLTGEALETEEDRKLKLILSKAQHHQQQLRDQQTNSENSSPSPATRKKLQGIKNSPRFQNSRLSSISKSPDRMSSSCYSTSSNLINSPLMTQSLDPTMLSHTISQKNMTSDRSCQSNEKLNENTEKCFEELTNTPLQALTKLVPVPESLMSPDYRPSPLINRITQSPPVNNIKPQSKAIPVTKSPRMSRAAVNRTKGSELRKGVQTKNPFRLRKVLECHELHNNKTPPSCLRKSISSDDESEICVSKLQTIQMKAEEAKRLQRNPEVTTNSSNEDKVERAAVKIQKVWRGYYTRNKDQKVIDMLKGLQAQRAQQYIEKLTTDMESTKAALESERKIQMLQMQAINALWKKVSTLQQSESGDNHQTPDATLNSSEVVRDLAQTCCMLQSQIQQLQGSMQDMIKFMSILSQTSGIHQQIKDAIATQTEISAVHTPQGEAAKFFPFHKQSRPSSLPLPVHQRVKNTTVSNTNTELQQFAGSLVEDVIKDVSETATQCEQNGETNKDQESNYPNNDGDDDYKDATTEGSKLFNEIVLRKQLYLRSKGKVLCSKYV
ncbi:centrosomal protein of 97 kDa [Agrilus planipennis]|uniref:Centrosomal protein of 97 kDa n=1 Tax=Agrilus planipennis TaxID=224129 RepID=A0A7F5R7L7_AGRPL|nr:centrosomal protein of 97 kDa [Agrilus planipennis]